MNVDALNYIQFRLLPKYSLKPIDAVFIVLKADSHCKINIT